MTGLSSLVAEKKTVAFGDATVDLCGLSLRKAAHLIGKYPDLIALLGGKTADIEKVILTAPDGINEVVALAIDGATDEVGQAFLRSFDNAPLGTQVSLLIDIGKMTAGEGDAVPFVLGLASRLNSAKGSTPPVPQSASDQAPETSAATSPSSSDT